jgi:hypothetical protein
MGMARYANDGMIKIVFAVSVANKAAPTAAELNGGTDISNFITKDGLQVPANQNMVDNSSLAEVYDAQVVGSFGGPITLTGIRDAVAANDTAWNLFTYGLTGFIGVRRGIATATTFSAAQKVEVYPIMSADPLPVQTASNEQGRFTVTCAVTSQPNLKATVA